MHNLKGLRLRRHGHHEIAEVRQLAFDFQRHRGFIFDEKQRPLFTPADFGHFFQIRHPRSPDRSLTL
ncbi:protein of unknown function (plasmid) [Methylocella tundrae]|uniref:Uncharacterized protein n=1 Tax=Methylocella tundrae TaxID=227605 RepID=A0A4U8Z6I9_METTU|nr:protein of unknown function [Methylocella tundrae]